MPPRVCRACYTSITDFMPFFVLCRISAHKWKQTVNYLNTVSVDKQATTAYVLIEEEPQTLADRSTTKNKTPKEVLKNIRLRLNYIRASRKRSSANMTICKRKGSHKFSCPDCNKGGFAVLYKFNFHLNINKKHCCPHCYKIMNVNDFGKHLATHNLPSFECNVCHLHFEKETSLQRHKIYHNRGKFMCPECKYTFKSMDGLTIHTNYVHTTMRCACGKIFHGKGCYHIHKRRVCPKKRNQSYICDYCSKSFTKKCTLGKHIENYHTVKSSEQCEQCGKTFKTKAHLKEHSYAHDKVLDRFTCEYCGKIYSTPRGFRRHMTRKHYQVNPELYKKKPYPCAVCNKVLTSETNLKNHTLRQHEKKPTSAYVRIATRRL